ELPRSRLLGVDTGHAQSPVGTVGADAVRRSRPDPGRSDPPGATRVRPAAPRTRRLGAIRLLRQRIHRSGHLLARLPAALRPLPHPAAPLGSGPGDTRNTHASALKHRAVTLALSEATSPTRPGTDSPAGQHVQGSRPMVTTPEETGPATDDYLGRRTLRTGTAGWVLLAGLG